MATATLTTDARYAEVAECEIGFFINSVLIRNTETNNAITLTRTQLARLPFALRLKIDSDAAVEAPVALTLEERKMLVRVSKDADLAPAQPAPAPVVPVVPAPAPVVMHSNHASMNVINRQAAARNVPSDLNRAAADEAKLAALQNAVTVAGEKLYLMFYDIPDASGVANPSLDLWRLGCCRFQLSCWVAHESVINHPAFQRWANGARSRGCTVDVYEQSETTRVRMVEECQKKLDAYLREMHTSLIRSIDAADQKMGEAIREAQELQSYGGEEKAVKARDNVVRTAINLAAKRLEGAIAAAEKFDGTGATADLVAAMREAIRARAEAFNASAYAKGIKRVTV